MRIKGDNHKSKRIYRYDARYRLIVLSHHHLRALARHGYGKHSPNDQSQRRGSSNLYKKQANLSSEALSNFCSPFMFFRRIHDLFLSALFSSFPSQQCRPMNAREVHC
jgi:hypothetical protein